MRARISPAALLVKVMARTSSGRTPAHLDQVGHAVGEHARLARAGAGEDEQRALEVLDGLALRLVEAGEQGFGGGRPAAAALWRAARAGSRAGALIGASPQTQVEQGAQGQRTARRPPPA